jgi:hypothetical protein
MLFSRMAESISEFDTHAEIFIIDFENGAMARNLQQQQSIRLLPFTDGQPIQVPKHAVLVMQSILPYSMRPELLIPPQTRILFWTLHPDNLVPVLLPVSGLRNLQYKYYWFYRALGSIFYRSTQKKLKDFVELCLEKKALYFMDETNLNKTNKYLGLNIHDVDFLPVPAADAAKFKTQRSTDMPAQLSFCWIGRLCDWKAYILMYTIRCLSEVAASLKTPVVYYVIGNGDFYDAVKRSGVGHPFFRLELMGALSPKEVDEFLMKRVDVVTAMGTSALEGARSGIPVILLDFSYYPVKVNYKFRWLYNAVNFDLAHEIGPSDLEKNNRSLEEMVREVIEDYPRLSERTRSYFIDHHAIETVRQQFIMAAQGTQLRFSDIDPRLLRKSILRRIYDRIRYNKAD